MLTRVSPLNEFGNEMFIVGQTATKAVEAIYINMTKFIKITKTCLRRLL